MCSLLNMHFYVERESLSEKGGKALKDNVCDIIIFLSREDGE